MRRLFKIFVPLIFLVAGIYIFGMTARPVTYSRENSATVKAVVSKIKAGGLQDIAITLDRVRGLFYINKGVTRGISVEHLNTQLLHKEVTILYAEPQGLSRLSPMTTSNHITEVRLGENVIYTEF
jgi:hypothetical protein